MKRTFTIAAMCLSVFSVNAQRLYDYSSKLVNNSFEDFSAQGGKEVKGCANPPAGWQIFKDGVECTSGSEIGVAECRPHAGVNENRDGNNVFTLWNGTIPQFEISQKLVGLPTGTYKVTAKMVFSHSWFVDAANYTTKLTSQRIFANQNSQYYGSEGDYNENTLAADEIAAFAGNVEADGDNDAFQNMEVTTTVTDGVLTLGARTNGICKDGTTGDGSGIGWMKIDDFHLYLVVNSVEDAIAALQSEIASALTLEGSTITGGTRELLNQEIAKSQSLLNSNSIDDVLNQVTALTVAENAVKESVLLCEQLTAAGDGIYDWLADNDRYVETEAGAQLLDIADKISTDKEENFSDYTDESAKSLIQQIANLKVFAMIQSDCVNGAEITHFGKNMSFEDLSSQDGVSSTRCVNPPAGWSIYKDGVQCATGSDIAIGSCSISANTQEGVDGGFAFSIWNPTIPQFEISQKITNLPNGTYKVTAKMMYSHSWFVNADQYTTKTTSQRIFANNHVQYFASASDYNENTLVQGEEASFANNTEADGDQDAFQNLEVTTTVTDHTLTFGARTNGICSDGSTGDGSGMGWMKLDDFHIYAIDVEDASTGITDVKTEAENADATIRYYDLNGMQHQQLKRGVNIVKKGNQVIKVIR